MDVLVTTLGERQVVTRRVHMSESWTGVNGARQDFRRWHGANIANVVQNEFIEEAEDSLRLPSAFYSVLDSNQFHKVVSGAGVESLRMKPEPKLI